MKIIQGLLLLFFIQLAESKNKCSSYSTNLPKPTPPEIRYGTHERNVLDLRQADSQNPTPVALVIHGAGWKEGSK